VCEQRANFLFVLPFPFNYTFPKMECQSHTADLYMGTGSEKVRSSSPLPRAWLDYRGDKMSLKLILTNRLNAGTRIESVRSLSLRN